MSLHRKLVKHDHAPGDIHELTFSCCRRLPLLTNDVWQEMFCRAIDPDLPTIHGLPPEFWIEPPI